MAEEVNVVRKYTTSDKLGIALACLAGVMAIILSLVERTPWTVAGLLVAMAALLVYPVLHFAPRTTTRVLLFACVAILTAAFGWYVWPKNQALGDQSMSVPAQITTTPPVNTPVPAVKTPKAEPQKPQPPPSVKIEQHGAGSGAVGGNIQQGPCSNLQVGGAGNTASTNCGLMPREVRIDDQNQFARIFKNVHSTIVFFAASNANDGARYARSLQTAFTKAGANASPWIMPLGAPTSEPYYGVQVLCRCDYLANADSGGQLRAGSSEQLIVQALTLAHVDGLSVAPTIELPPNTEKYSLIWIRVLSNPLESMTVAPKQE